MKYRFSVVIALKTVVAVAVILSLAFASEIEYMHVLRTELGIFVVVYR